MSADSSITIRLATEGEAGALHGLQMRAFAEEARLCRKADIPPLLETEAEILAHIRLNIAYVAELNGEIVGAVRGQPVEEGCRIRALIVEPAHQKKGIGRQLLKFIESVNESAPRIVLTTNTLVPGNREFYERHGYHVDELENVFADIFIAHMSKPRNSTPPSPASG